jgi:hypothetical protein
MSTAMVSAERGWKWHSSHHFAGAHVDVADVGRQQLLVQELLG